MTSSGKPLDNVAVPRIAAVALAVVLLAPSPAVAAGQTPLARKLSRALADFFLGRSLEPGATILVARKNDDEVDITVVPGAPPAPDEKVTVPPDDPESSAEPDESAEE